MSATEDHAPDRKGACPKCGFLVAPQAEACARCGLGVARWDSFDRGGALTTLGDEGERLWVATTAAWNEPAAHDAFLKHCSAAGTLGAAGRRYRERLDATPDDPVARKMQDRVLGMASIGLAASARLRVPDPVTRKWWFWTLLFVSMGAGMIVAIARRH